ncbi:BREX-1 system adenine-specific DNA-methyltransferase PglX [Mesorhizobium sp. M6A.T.Cr.TU.017.01.1.1]|uniref:BREX-1 system adenine-specific DNA-methyltransferase PglX n=1 Tax=Mesorhizobium sp. M6A.T.Cr.TU.017.01.1.1 TaxID=2496774 RepID=UPI000FD5DEDC|nr:BREX-1 system adenine-specific DNA-methyltransferase PglX [Mesorhizobium sp. M6A.T.Cr.TU.017.01.1.1]RUU97106.1 BREX-1 system adenine-specific DNA-methyltransferase PglX [Mesorhizobium sp. M6A.T.Cr.TU.017.01.1.1]
MDATTPQKLDTSGLKKFAQAARRTLMQQVATKLDHVLADGSAARRENPNAVKELKGQVATHGKEQVIERVAYTWFNRFSALRFMDVNGYTRIGVLSPGEGQTRPEILAEAAAGHIDDDVPEGVRQEVAALLDGRRPSRDPQGEAYRLLLVATCNQWHQTMPFLFEKIADYTELLMPEDLLSSDSILARMREVMTAEACRDVEIIGWLYQFYISEKKDQVFAGLKKNQKITPENIPAATQLFTPHWIVRYLVENSLGRLWMLNRPASKLAARMDYYIAPEEPEEDFLHVSSPEEIRVCDPACGSGHMLTYAFDLLYAIYEEEGHDPAEIPEKILTHNLYGIEIDERAGALAAFALVMKAMGRRKRFLRRPVQPNICVLENASFEPAELAEYTATVGRDLFTADLCDTLSQFAEAKNFGSLIVPKLRDISEVVRLIATKDFESNLFLRDVHSRVQAILRMADFLSPKYQVVVTNPPYKKKADLNDQLQDWLEREFSDAKYDLYQAFILRNIKLAQTSGYVSMITMQGWMFAPRYESLRSIILSTSVVSSMAQLGERAFDSIGGEVVSTTAFVLLNRRLRDHNGQFIKLTDGQNEAEKDSALLSAVKSTQSTLRFRASESDFRKIPGQPLVFWASEKVRRAFDEEESISQSIVTREGLTTGSNAIFLREWFEVEVENAGFGIISSEVAQQSRKRWFPYVKGGGSRRWYGNLEHFVNWYDDGAELKNFRDGKTGRVRSHNYNGEYGFRAGFTWSGISGNDFAIRDVPSGFMFDAKGPMGFNNNGVSIELVEGFLNSRVSSFLLRMLAPTLDFKLTHVLSLPLREVSDSKLEDRVIVSIALAKSDWDAYETSWDFTLLPVLSPEHCQATLAETYAQVRTHWQGMTEKMRRLEEENNRVFIDAYGLQDELTPEVPIEEITLTCNPAYRYGGARSESELENALRSDTMREFLSYAVGCMFGRYSLDAPGLILANQGEGFEDYLKRVPEPKFSPDKDNVIPILDGDWFPDDMADGFRRFLRTTFGERRFSDNLAFIETALGKDIRRFFLRDFYDDHVRRYKKRPIYWLFSSPRGTFNALIYMHRYRADTVSTVLDYLREFRRKLDAHRSQLEAISTSSASTQAEKVKALKEIESVSRDIDELDVYERDVLYPLATQRIEIDLDDGVKVNYAKFGAALKPIKGLAAEEE